MKVFNHLSALVYVSIGNCNSSSTSEDRECDDSKEALRKEVEKLFNLHYGTYVLSFHFISVSYLCML